MADEGNRAASGVVGRAGRDVTPELGRVTAGSARCSTIRSSLGHGCVERAEPTWTDDMPIFLSPRWLASQSSDYGWLVAEPTSEVRIVLPYVARRQLALRWLQFQWPVVATEDIDPETERAFLEGVVEWCRAHRLDFITPPPVAAVFRTAPAGALCAPFGTVVLDLTSSEDVLWAGMQGKCRNMIRKAIAEGVTTEWGGHLADEAHALCTETMERSGLGFLRLSVFRRTAASLGPFADIGIARLDGAAKACLFVAWSRFGAHGMYAGTAAPATPGAANLLHWEAIRRAKGRGVARYDLMGVRPHAEPGSKYEGMQRFKQRFGGELVEGCLWKMPLVGWKSDLYAALKRVRGDSIDVIDSEMAAGRGWRQAG